MIKDTILSQDQIRENNRVLIIRFIKERGTTTKQEIAKHLGLSIPTVTHNIQQLIEEGIVEEAGVAESTGGRKPIILRFVPNARYSFGVDIGAHRVQICLVDLDAAKIASENFELVQPIIFSNLLNNIKERIHKIVDKHNIPKEHILGVGFSLPGLVDDDNLVLAYAPNIEVRNFSFKTFEQELGFKVYIENEANIAAYAEQLMGNATNIGNGVYVSVTEGVGTGIIIENHIYKSNGKRAGEYGHIRVSDDQVPCKCGRKGCWEVFASTNALLRFYKHYKNETATVDEIFNAYNNNDNAAKLALEVYTRYLFKGIENILLSINPDFVIIGGDIGAYADIIIDLAKNELNLYDQYIGYEDIQIMSSAFKNNGSLIGAALLPMEELFNYKKYVI